MRKLYKFVKGWDAARYLAQGKLKFTQVGDLNDPAELVPAMNVEAVSESLKNIRHNGYTREQLSWLRYQEKILDRLAPEYKVIPAPKNLDAANMQIRHPIYDDFELMKRVLCSTIDIIKSRVGILSLTERFDCLPMWAHYADLARGCVLGFRGLEAAFPGDDTGSLNIPKQIRYIQNFIGMTFAPETQDNLFFCKFEDWAYEKEWRVVCPLSDCSYNDKGLSLIHI